MCGKHIGRLNAIVLVLFTVEILLLSAFPIAQGASGDTLRRGDYFNYDTYEHIANCEGGYYGYSEHTDGSGHYEISAISSDNVTVKYNWKWHYISDTEPSKSDYRDDTIFFNKRTRNYTSGFDLDEKVSPNRTVWFYIDPDVTLGQQVMILDKPFTVTQTKTTIWTKWVPRITIELTYEDVTTRHDSYGDFIVSSTDRYYMDAKTGYIVVERYKEHDTGTWDGLRSDFDIFFDFDVTSSSYSTEVNWLEVFLWYVSLPAIIFGFLYLLYYAARWTGRTYYTDDYNTIRIKRLWRSKHINIAPEKTTLFFQPFIDNMIKKALATGDRVAVAYDSRAVFKGLVVGVAFYHKDAKIGTVLAIESDVAEYLRKYIKAKDFFSEVRHRNRPKSIMLNTNQDTKLGTEIYNIYETHRILMKNEIKPELFDSSIIRLMKPDDLAEVCMISKKVYKIKGKKWFKTLLNQGDIGIVALIDGKVVGFAFATVVEEHARFHSLTVHPDYRGRGIGKELMRARLNFVYHVGGTDAMVEIANWNLPSIRISTSFGFTPSGDMYVETIRTKRIRRNIVRR